MFSVEKMHFFERNSTKDFTLLEITNGSLANYIATLLELIQING